MYFDRMFSSNSARFYRKVLILRVMLIVMFAVDALAIFFTPVWVLVIFLVVHIVILVCWINVCCRLLDMILSDLRD